MVTVMAVMVVARHTTTRRPTRLHIYEVTQSPAEIGTLETSQRHSCAVARLAGD